MLNYRIENREGRHPVPVVVIETPGYELVSEFLLAEGRSFAIELLQAMDRRCLQGEKSSSFSGNVFSLEIKDNTACITDDISDRSCEIPANELRDMTEAYLKACQSSDRKQRK